MSKRTGAVALVVVLVVVMVAAAYGLSTECYPIHPRSDHGSPEECKPRIAHYLGY